MDEQFGLYIHIPYCIKKCPYCDFNSYSVGTEFSTDTEKHYTGALVAELQHYAELPEWHGRECATIFFGGGTPSLFRPESIGRLLDVTATLFKISPEAEITLEANPGTIQEDLGKAKLEGFRAAGINRISMGVQSFRPEKLTALGRIHSADEAERAARNIAAAGFLNFNLDLIFGVYGDTTASWKMELSRALSLAPAHVSAYGLTIEPGTDFGRLQKAGKLPLLADEVQAELYELTQELCAANGYAQYEISNYARTGSECRHNLGYWSGRDYLGLGAGAHSFLGQDLPPEELGKRWSNLPGPAHYLSAVNDRGEAAQRIEEIDREKSQLEFFFLGLRTRNGVNLSDFETRFQSDIPAALTEALKHFEKENLLECSGKQIRLSKKGFLFADGVLTEIAAAL